METPTLTTDRLTIRPPKAADAPGLRAALDDFEIVRWTGSIPFPYGLSDAEGFIAGVLANPGARQWVIEDDRGLCGGIGTDAELGYWLTQDRWGRGYAGEAVTAVLADYFARPEAPPLMSSYLAENHRSARVLTRAGFGATRVVRRPSRALGQEVPLQEMVLTPEQYHSLNPWRIETERLRLRPLVQEDAAELARIGGLPEVAPMIFVASVPWPKADAARLIERDRWRGRLGFRFGIELKETGALLGMIGISREPHVFYFLDPAHWGRGLIGETLAAFVPAVMDRFGLAELGADVFQDNPASAAALERQGFQRIGEDLATSGARVEPSPVWVYRLARHRGDNR